MKNDNQSDDKSKPSVYRRLIMDHRISPGAFRFWHYLHNRRGKDGECYPTQREIASDLKCKTHSLPAWTDQLKKAGYLLVRSVGQNHNFRYTPTAGDGAGVMPEWATRRVAQRGDTNSATRSPKGNDASPNGATPRVAPKGDLRQEVVRERSKGAPPMFPREIDRWITDLRAEVKKVSSEEARPLLEKLWPLEEEKFGRRMTRAPKAKSAATTITAEPAAPKLADIPHSDFKAACDEARAAINAR